MTGRESSRARGNLNRKLGRPGQAEEIGKDVRLEMNKVMECDQEADDCTAVQYENAYLLSQ